MIYYKHISLYLLFFCCFISAKEYYIRLPSGEIVAVSTAEDISLENAIISGAIEISFSTTNSDSVNNIEHIDETLMSDLLSALEFSSASTHPLTSASNIIELINICPLPVAGEEKYKYKCSIPTCNRRFEFLSAGSNSKKSKHHKTHFKPEFLESLKGQLVVCPYCHDTMTGILSTIMIHFSRYCSGGK